MISQSNQVIPASSRDEHIESSGFIMLKSSIKVITLLLCGFAVPERGAAADLPEFSSFVLRGTEASDIVYNWTGVYIGVNAGYGWGNASWGNAGNIYSATGGLFGGQLGYNWQLGQMVYSLEGNIDITDLQGTIDGLACGKVRCSAKDLLLSTMPAIRARFGMALGRWLPYFAFGMAVGDIRTDTYGNVAKNVFGLEEINQTSAGWTVGVGIEGALINNWSAKLEYLYTDFGSTKCALFCLPAGTTFDYTMRGVRAGLNYRF
jgi:outer membrane immunogenic protein